MKIGNIFFGPLFVEWFPGFLHGQGTVGRELVNGAFKVEDCKEKFYETGTGIKVTLKGEPDSDHKFYAVFFAKSAYYDVADALKEGDVVMVRAERKSNGEGHTLLSVFFLEKMSSSAML